MAAKKNQESVFPPRQQFALAESNITTLESLESIEGLQLLGEGLNGKLALILINFSSCTVEEPISHPAPWKETVHMFLEQSTHSLQEPEGKRPFVQILGICALIADCYFLSQSCRQKGQCPLFNHLHYCKYSPSEIKRTLRRI